MFLYQGYIARYPSPLWHFLSQLPNTKQFYYPEKRVLNVNNTFIQLD